MTPHPSCGIGFALAAAAGALLACSSAASNRAPSLLAVGSAAPEVVAEDPQGKTVRLSGLRGEIVAVYFYPKDETPGCTKQACAFRDAWDKLRAAGIHVIGVSRDDAQSHRAFQKHHELPFALAPDPEGKVQAAFGVPSRMPGIAARVTFLIDKQGAIAQVWPDVDPALDANNVLEAAKKL